MARVDGLEAPCRPNGLHAAPLPPGTCTFGPPPRSQLDTARDALLGVDGRGVPGRAASCRGWRPSAMEVDAPSRRQWSVFLVGTDRPPAPARGDLRGRGGRELPAFTNTRHGGSGIRRCSPSDLTGRDHRAAPRLDGPRHLGSGWRTALREGRLRCVACTSTLDLGVDHPGGPGPPGRESQERAGWCSGRAERAPARRGQPVSPGVPTNAPELVDAAAARGALIGARSRPAAPSSALDLLAQHAVTVALGGGFRAEELPPRCAAPAYRGLRNDEWRGARLHHPRRPGAPELP
jgi:hypothetical protein